MYETNTHRETNVEDHKVPSSPNMHAMKQMLMNRRGSKKKKYLHLTNLNRLKYDSVHLTIGRTFIPSSLGIVNEDLYI